MEVEVCLASPHHCPLTLPLSSSRCPGVSGAEGEERHHQHRRSGSGHTAMSGEGNAPPGGYPHHLETVAGKVKDTSEEGRHYTCESQLHVANMRVNL